MKNILSFDVEEHFQVEAFRDIIPRSSWNERQSRLTMNMIRILDILDQYRTQATFFFLGWIAEKYPHLVAMVKSRGHEIASHGYSHEKIGRMSPDQFKDDLTRSLELLDAAASIRVRGYRAPTFSAARGAEWFWETLADHGIEYDSSIFPVRHDLYGDPSAPRFPYFVQTSRGKILEIPPTTYRIAGRSLPACGGGSFRLFPYWFTRKAIRAYNSRGYPAMVYLHPWEVDPSQPRETAAGFKSRLRHYTNLNTVEPKLRRLLRDFQFSSVSEVYFNSKESLLFHQSKGISNG